LTAFLEKYPGRRVAGMLARNLLKGQGRQSAKLFEIILHSFVIAAGYVVCNRSDLLFAYFNKT
jgi:hypothetical protein